MGLVAYSFGLPLDAKNMLNEALTKKWGEGTITVQDLSISNLRMKVRSSAKNPSVVFVVLDATAKSKCEGIADDLFMSEKFCEYSDTISFVHYLNTTFGTSFEYEEDLGVENSESSNFVSEEEIERAVESATEELRNEISFKDRIIKNLRNNLAELTAQVQSETGINPDDRQEEIDALQSEILSLKNELLESKAEAHRATDALENSKSNVVYPDDYDDLRAEVTKLRSTTSMQSSVIESKNEKIESLSSALKDAESEKDGTSKANTDLVETNREQRRRIRELEEELKNNKEESAKLVQNLIQAQSMGTTKEEVEALQTGKNEAEAELETAKQTLFNTQNDLATITEERDSLKEDIVKLKEKRTKLEESIKEKDERHTQDQKSIRELNEQLRDTKAALGTLNDLSKGETDVNAIVTKLVTEQKELSKVKSSPFYKISEQALPTMPLDVNLLEGVPLEKKYDNLNFIFAGNAESQRGVYKILKNGFAELYMKMKRTGEKRSEFLLVDLVTETSIDYVFGLRSFKKGLDWLQVGGSLQNYISSADPSDDPSTRNAKFLMMHLSYVNDAYFLTVDWPRRLEELNNSGYQVYIFCGNLSNMVSRIMFDSFAPHVNPMRSKPLVYVLGTTVSCRTIIANSQCLANFGSSLVLYYNQLQESEGFRHLLEKRTGAETRCLNMVTRAPMKTKLKADEAKQETRNFGERSNVRGRGKKPGSR